MNEDTSRSGDSPHNTQSDATPPINNMKEKSIWMRLFFMFVVALFYSVSRVVVGAVVFVQFFWVLFTGEQNNKLLILGHALSTYTYQIIMYLTFNTDDRPFPFDRDWPNPN